MAKLTYEQKKDRANPCISIRFKRAQLRKIDKHLSTIKLARAVWVRKLVLGELHRLKMEAIKEQEIHDMMAERYAKRGKEMSAIFGD